VIAIIAILASLLLPALSKAREKARRAICLSNQKQQYTGTALFADDRDQMLPAGGDAGSTPGAVRVQPLTVLPMWETVFPDGQYTWGQEWVEDYLGVALTASYNPTNPGSVLRCPSSGGRVLHRSSALFTNYCHPGTSVYSAPYTNPYAIARATRLWGDSVSGMERLFSYDAVVHNNTPGPDSGNKMRTHYPRSSHMNGDGICEGMNIVTVDGAGRWLGVRECNITTWGWWIYYQRMFPKNYEMMFQGHRTRGAISPTSWSYVTDMTNLHAVVTYGSTRTYTTSLGKGGMGKFGYFNP
jgi:hypothetical protein